MYFNIRINLYVFTHVYIIHSFKLYTLLPEFLSII